ncbi:MAG: hypothetical protein AAB271_06185, partial [Nitrospirota bacterium]
MAAFTVIRVRKGDKVPGGEVVAEIAAEGVLWTDASGGKRLVTAEDARYRFTDAATPIAGINADH